jgi:hypothetical protein
MDAAEWQPAASSSKRHVQHALYASFMCPRMQRLAAALGCSHIA